MNRVLVLLFSLVCALGAVGAADRTPFKAGEFTPPRAAPDFSLRGSDGGEVTLHRYRGKVVLLVFGFTQCPAVCPVTLALLADVRKQLGTAGGEVQVVFITVDPERDNADIMRQYVTGFDPTFIGGTGMPDQLAAVRKNYGVTARKVPMSGSYAVDHSSSIYLIDREGKLRAMMPFGRKVGDYVHDLGILLKVRTAGVGLHFATATAQQPGFDESAARLVAVDIVHCDGTGCARVGGTGTHPRRFKR